MDSGLTAALITIGDEILIGQIVNTNATHLSIRLTELGYSVETIISVSDREEAIQATISDCLDNYNVVITTGGLGPTHDDITKAVLLKLFGGTWVRSEEQLAVIRQIFEKRGRTVSDLNLQQADVPSTARALINETGTAPGLWFSRNGHDLFVLPGVPTEMKFLMDDRIRPILKQKNTTSIILQKTLRTTGIPESTLAERIGPVEQFLPGNATLAFLPSFSGVRLRVMVKGDDSVKLEKELDRLTAFLAEKAGSYFYSSEDEDLEAAVIRQLKSAGQTLSVAESITGGLIGDKLTNIPGASDVFMASLVTYSNSAKTVFLDVKTETLNRFGAVSEATAAEMAEGIRRRTGTDFGLAVTGIAGPGGGSQEKPVGLVFVSASSAAQTETRRLLIPGDRKMIKERAAFSALNLLREFISPRLQP